jgi:D-beta-D-heptose 7-phosphate kinase/D-beta-D-heptose 1-phosphate adenosyltransferase
VDLVVPFSADTPIDLIRRIQPDVYTKGGDYTIDRLPEAEVVERFGGVVQILPLVNDRSTSRIIERVLDINPAAAPADGRRRATRNKVATLVRTRR